MLNANQADAAIKALTYPSGISDRDERVAAHLAYREAERNIIGEFCEWLADEYASTLPASVQSRIWSKSWEEGHSSGFGDVENYYIDNAEFAKFVINEAPRPTAG